ncbi:MAG: uroporphyrinogen-III C-methyltransferase [Betaproteobacteria bacterium]|nr:uroporphyrinogen-III C-methyltransferase [Betaproteobacteria bacterium]
METNPQPAPPEPPAAPPAPASGTALRVLVGVLIVAALGASGWVYYDARLQLGATQEALARQLKGVEDDAREARAAARSAQEAAREMQAKFGALEARVADAQSQQAALESLYQELSRNRDEWQLAEIEQVLAIAQQQLQLAGNVRSGLLALQLAESRLSRADRPQFQPVRRALARDIERLKSLPAADLAGMARRLDGVLGAIDDLPLALDARLERPAPAAPAPAKESFVAHFGANLWRDLKELVIVRRVDKPAPPLLPPEQAYFLRENLRLRLLNARLALLSRNQPVFEADLRAARQWLQRYYDARARPTQAALSQLGELQGSPISFEPPSIADSLDAVRAFKSRRDRNPG